MKTSMYRLGEYKIIEYDNSDLTWESHFGLVAQREGRCYVKGNILFIGPWINEEAGLFKNEFLIYLNRLPAWDKTKYYSLHFEIYSCKTGRRVSPEEMRQINVMNSPAPEALGPQEEPDNISYRLNRYEIVCRSDEEIKWKALKGPRSSQSGKCLVMEDILFFGPCDGEQACMKKEFLAHLKSLPTWKHTEFFCRRLDLHYCETGTPLALGEDPGSPAMTPLIKQNERIRNGQYGLKGSLQKELSNTIPKLHFYKDVIFEVSSKYLLPHLSSLWKLSLGILERWKGKWLK